MPGHHQRGPSRLIHIPTGPFLDSLRIRRAAGILLLRTSVALFGAHGSLLFERALVFSTLNTFAVFSGLSANITYYLRVQAVGNGGATIFVSLPTAVTSLLPPASGATTFTTVDIASVTAQWANGRDNV